MALLGMPLLIVNMGGEMVYILEQRLHAQAIAPDKSKRVLQDVIKTMFNPKFVEELFKPQELYSNTSMRGIFDRLAHSSIMRLSESSMDKLYDLMTMGVKYQLVCSGYAAEMVDVSMNHLDAMRLMIEDPHIVEVLETFITTFKKRYGEISMADFNEIRQTLCRFFQDRRIKVSLFLQEGLQANTGSMIFPKEEEVPPGSEVPGKIRYFNGGEISKTTTFAYTGTALPRDRPIRSKLGINLYQKNKPHALPGQVPAILPTNPAQHPNPFAPQAHSRTAPSTSEPQRSDLQPSGIMGAAELNMLADLIRPSSTAKPDKDALKINLFGADLLGSAAYDTDPRYAIFVTDLITLDPTRKVQHLDSVIKDMSLKDNAPVSQEQDLLDLMDSAK